MAKIRDKLHDMNPLLRWFLYLLGGLLILIIILQLLVSFVADDYVAYKLKEQAKKSSNSTYTIEFDDFDLNVFSGSATLTHLRINADSAAFKDSDSSAKPPNMLYNGHIGEVDIGGINVFSTLLGKKISVNSITITEPDISALKNPTPIKTDTGKSFSSIDSTIYAALSGRYSSLEIDDFSIHNGRAQLTSSGNTVSSVEQFNLSLQNIHIDSASAQSGRMFITKDLSVNAGEFDIKLSDSLNIIAFDKLSISSDQQSVEVDSLEIIPRYGKLEFARKNGTRIDRIDLTVPSISIQKVDFATLIDSAKFYAGHAEINDANFRDYLNKGVPGGPPKPKTLPFVKFKTLNQPIKIDSLKVKDSFIAYSEYAGNTPRAGTITFENLDATFHNISNYPGDIASGLTTTLDTRSRVMGTGLLNAYFEFPMDTENGFHKIKGRLNSMNITDFNRILEHVAFVRADRGMLNNLEFDMTLNQDRSSGTLIMNYEDLKISVLDQQSKKQKGLLENIKTFLANNMVVKKNNTPKKGMQAGEIKFNRIKHKSIFNYWWKSLLSGIKDSIKE